MRERSAPSALTAWSAISAAARLSAIANTLYAGQAISLAEGVNVEELADVLLDMYAKGAIHGCRWIRWAVADVQLMLAGIQSPHR
jgi:hypothetical protein